MYQLLSKEVGMQQLYDVFFASSNKNKYLEAKAILSRFEITLGFFKCTLKEMQSNVLKEVAYHKVLDAFDQCLKPVIVEDDGLFIKSLRGFPGPYSSFVFKTIGNEGILRLLNTQRVARFYSVIAYCDKKKKTSLFEAYITGKISKKPNGKKWGFDPIFIPDGSKKTFAQIVNKNFISHRYLALKKFANWFVHKRQ
ncbi:MAG: dITP/XTP pyrophosphatase [Marine Group I thaumarchaeote]|nr:MAG: dITP/XTP pyrophosphatase [Nitrosopumilales archaeon]GFN39483.1 MAG: dITP/XTP pyrophosphatase [Marine Group I thaumarchaeote]